MDITQQLYEILSNSHSDWFSTKQLYEMLHARTPAERKEAAAALRRMREERLLVYDKRNNRYRKVTDRDFGTAVFQSNAKGFGFLLVEGGDDLFVPPNKTNGAFHRDKVLYRKTDGARGEAEVVKVLERGMPRLVGTYCKSRTSRFVSPDERRFVSDVYIPPKRDMGAQNGQKVVVRVTYYPRDNRNDAEGEIVSVLGFPDERNVDMLSVAANYNLSQTFPEAAEKAARALPQKVTASDLVGRRDLRGERIFTIDGEDAKDLDDAVGITQNADGSFTLGVHIADVSHYVPLGGEVDSAAFERGTSVYFPQTVFPMLPTPLSNGICSLYEGEDRLALSCVMRITGGGEVADFQLFPSVIRSCHRMTYADVQSILDGDKALASRYSDITPDLFAMDRLARILSDRRGKLGNIPFATREVSFVYDDDGEVMDVVPAENGFSHEIIEQFMLAANETAARFARESGCPFVYRVHAKPDSDKLDVLFALMRSLGIDVKRPKRYDNAVLQDALAKAAQTPYFALVNDVMLRSMQKAEYSDVNKGHFGLASDCYCHFTSPIRRYADLTVHRMIKRALSGDPRFTADDRRICREAALRASAREKSADEAERKADDVKKCAYASRIVGKEFEAVVSGVTERGLFAELPNTVEGFLSADKLGAVQYDAERFCLRCASGRYSLGDKVRVRVSSVDRQACRIDFDLAAQKVPAK